jgi:DNA-directed RNA polymerase subunit RPC12/RpoP
MRAGIMPQRVECQKCRHVLYEGTELTPPDEIVQRYNGKCPNCGKKLLFNPANVDVKPLK